MICRTSAWMASAARSSARVHVGHDRHRRRMHPQRAVGVPPSVGFIRAQWKGAHGQRHDAPGAKRPGLLPARATAAVLPAMTTCPGASCSRGLTTSPWAASAGLGDLARSSPHGRHRACAHGHRFLHVAPATTDDAHGVDEAERPAATCAGTEAVACDERRPDAAPLEQPERGDAGRQDRRLRSR